MKRKVVKTADISTIDIRNIDDLSIVGFIVEGDKGFIARTNCAEYSPIMAQGLTYFTTRHSTKNSATRRLLTMITIKELYVFSNDAELTAWLAE